MSAGVVTRCPAAGSDFGLVDLVGLEAFGGEDPGGFNLAECTGGGAPDLGGCPGRYACPGGPPG